MSVTRALAGLLLLGLSPGLLQAWTHTGAPSSGGNTTGLHGVVGLVVLIVLISAVPWLRSIGLMVLMIVLGLTGYVYRFELQGVAQHVLGALPPYRGEQVGKGSISFEAWPDGQFGIDALVNGTPVMFIADTGASEVVLTPRDAERLGYDLRDLDFSDAYTTANGSVVGAPIVLDEIAVGPIRMHHVAAVVNGAPMPCSLLGVSFLDRLKSYEVTGGVLTLTR